MIIIKSFASGLQTTTIQAVTPNDLINVTTSNRPLLNLYANDSKIVSDLESNLFTDRLFVDYILNNSASEVVKISNHAVFEQNLYMQGSEVKIFASQLSLTDSVIELNGNEAGAGVGESKAGINIDRDDGINFASALFMESDKYWHLSNSGVKAKTIPVEDLGTETPDFGYVDLKDLSSVSDPDVGKYRLFLNEDGNKLYATLREADSSQAQYLYNKSHYIYDDYIDTQDKFNKYFGSELLAGSGVTFYGWDYSNVSGDIHVYPKEDYKLVLRPGTYNLTTKVHLSRGILHGENFNDCVMNISNSSAGFIATNVNNVDFDFFTIDKSSASIDIDDLFTLNSCVNSKFYNVVRNIKASNIYDASNCFGLVFGDAFNNSALVFKTLTDSFYNGNYYSNLGYFESCTGIKEGFFSDSAVFGIGEWDDITESQAALS